VNGERVCWGCLAALALAAWGLVDAAGPNAERPPAKADKASAPVIRLNEEKDRVTVDVTGLSKESVKELARLAPGAAKWGEVLEVYVERGGKGRDGQPAMLGSHRLEKEVLRFEPRFPLVKGVSYRAILRPAALPGGTGKAVEAVLSLPKPQRKPSTVVAQVYPSANHLPENTLKFYLHFSAPMSQGDSYRHIKLLDARGQAVDLPFLELDQELWDASGMRFTLFFDPGRIKRGLKPREEVGPALEEGKRYTLVIERTWADAEGTPMKATFRKPFTVGAPDDTQPNPKTWRLRPPSAGKRSPLRVMFPKPMDHALLHRLMWVVDGSGDRVEGTVTVTQRETVWQFTPERPWRAGHHSLVADKRLEDVSGNNIARPFEVDVLRPVERAIKTETVRVPFRVKKAKN
jgi:hypothetical protein